MIEVWKRVPDCPNFEVSNLGRVKGFDTKRKAWTIRGQSKGSHGYMMVNLRYTDGKKGSECVHSLVCRVFHGPRPPAHDCCHSNGDRYDNRSENLRWGTRAENINDQKVHGTFGWRGKRKLSESDVAEINKRLKAGEGVIDLAREYEVNHGAILAINNGTTWSHLTGNVKSEATFNVRRGERSRKSLTEIAIIDIDKRLKLGETQASIAKIHGVKPQTISQINLGQIWGWFTHRNVNEVLGKDG